MVGNLKESVENPAAIRSESGEWMLPWRRGEVGGREGKWGGGLGGQRRAHHRAPRRFSQVDGTVRTQHQSLARGFSVYGVLSVHSRLNFWCPAGGCCVSGAAFDRWRLTSSASSSILIGKPSGNPGSGIRKELAWLRFCWLVYLFIY